MKKNQKAYDEKYLLGRQIRTEMTARKRWIRGCAKYLIIKRGQKIFSQKFSQSQEPEPFGRVITVAQEAKFQQATAAKTI